MAYATRCEIEVRSNGQILLSFSPEQTVLILSDLRVEEAIYDKIVPMSERRAELFRNVAVALNDAFMNMGV